MVLASSAPVVLITASRAWRVGGWALVQIPEDLAHAEREFRAIAERARPAPSQDRQGLDLRAHGALPRSLRSELQAAAIRDVVLPCAQRLLGAHGARARQDQPTTGVDNSA
jgi:hypothetical protein